MSEPQFGRIGAAVLKVLLSKFFLHLVESDHLDGVVQIKEARLVSRYSPFVSGRAEHFVLIPVVEKLNKDKLDPIRRSSQAVCSLYDDRCLEGFLPIKPGMM